MTSLMPYLGKLYKDFDVISFKAPAHGENIHPQNSRLCIIESNSSSSRTGAAAAPGGSRVILATSVRSRRLRAKHFRMNL